MSLSAAARLYLTWLIFDAVNRAPRRFDHLAEEIEYLADSWPEWRQAIMADRRFLVVGDAVNIATAGLPAEADLDEIIKATLDRARRPMTDQDLTRIIRRLRPDYPADRDPVAAAMNSGSFFRPASKHVARRRWLRDAVPVALPAGPVDDPQELALACVEQSGARVSGVGLAAALSARCCLGMEDAYRIVTEHPQLFLLPDGTVCLWDAVEEEIRTAAGASPSDILGLEETEEPTSGSDDLGESAELPPDLARRVVRMCRELGRSVTTAEVLTGMLKLAPKDERYLTTFWAVNHRLGLSTEVIAVGEHQWFDAAGVPADVFRRVHRNGKKLISNGNRAADGRTDARPFTGFAPAEPIQKLGRDGRPEYAFLVLSVDEIAAGCISDGRLGPLFPDTPQVQFTTWNGRPAWFNADTYTLVGPAWWLAQVKAAPGDGVLIRRKADGLWGDLRPGEGHDRGTGSVAPRGPTPQRRGTGKSPLLAVTEILTRAGGMLAKDELLALLQEEDVWLEWEDVAPLFRRYPSLGLAGDLCYLVSVTGKARRGGALRAEMLALLETAGRVDDSLRTDPVVLRLVEMAAAAPRISAEREALLLAEAQAGAKNGDLNTPAMGELVHGHTRSVVRYLLNRRDAPTLLPMLEDLFQVGCMGVVRAVRKFRRDKGHRLVHFLSWNLKSAVDRALLELRWPIVLPAHVQVQLDKVWRSERRPGEEAAVPPHLARWVEPEFLGSGAWEDVYEEGDLWLDQKTAPQAMPDPAAEAERAELAALCRDVLQTLKPREARVIRLRLGLDDDHERTLEEVGRSFGLTRERIRQIEAKALKKLRHSSRTRRLRGLGG